MKLKNKKEWMLTGLAMLIFIIVAASSDESGTEDENKGERKFKISTKNFIEVLDRIRM